ncbi:MAG: hypothetical protein MJZ15_08625 [Bacteroidales bacterium]|nr:hypothetical protein [Bacteroidales bacterium]
MRLINRLLIMFAVSNDEDLAAEENFEVSFSNVVNFMLLVHCIISGTHALLIENIAMTLSNMVFCILFICHFLSHYIYQRNTIITAIDRVVIFAQFIASFINGSTLGSAAISMLMYPFIAIILHGRRLGIALSLIQMIITGVYSSLCLTGVLPFTFKYTTMDVFAIFSVQFVSIFTYYFAIRGLSSLIYDRITEVGQLNEALGIKTELIKDLSDNIKSQLKNINTAAHILSHERLNVNQRELVANMKISSETLIDTVESIANASELDIKPIQKEEITFNIYNLVSNVLLLFGSKTDKGNNIHSVSMSPEVPQTVLGNSQLTRQIFLLSFEALDRKFKLTSTPMKVAVSMNDINADNLTLCFSIMSEKQIHLDHRDLSTSESKLLYQLQLDSTQRLVQAAGGEFTVEIANDESLQIEFTLPFKDVVINQNTDKDLDMSLEYTPVEPTVKTEDARVLIVSGNSDYCKNICEGMQNKVKDVITAPHSKLGIKTYENGKFDFVIVDMSDKNVEGHLMIRAIREIEFGDGPGVPIFAIVKDIDKETYMGDLTNKIDGKISEETTAKEIINIIEETLAIGQRK